MIRSWLGRDHCSRPFLLSRTADSVAWRMSCRSEISFLSRQNSVDVSFIKLRSLSRLCAVAAAAPITATRARRDRQRIHFTAKSGECGRERRAHGRM